MEDSNDIIHKIDLISNVEITEEMKRSYLDYAMSVIVSRALPDIRDGLKPVHRRILYAMHQIGLLPPTKHTKSAKVVGEVLGKYHPHGDMSVYDALVRLAQEFSMRYPLVEGQGNFGSIDGDPPAAMRYTEVRLAKISTEMLTDLEKETVNFSLNFDSTLKEPDWLPAKLPNLLLMGSDGIAVGMATKIPPHNLGEVIDAILHLTAKTSVARTNLEKGKHETQFVFDSSIEELMGYIKGPDFPTAGFIYDIEEIKRAYLTGKGRVVMRGKAEIEEIGNGKQAIIITELPFQVNKASLVSRIADLVKDKKLDGISDLRDESDRHGIRVVVELKRDAKSKKILNNLYKQTTLQSNFPVNMVGLINGVPQTLTLKIILEEFIKHRHSVITKRSEFELKEARAREHILEGLKIAVDNIDEVIAIIRKSKDVDTAKTNLKTKFSLSDLQAQAILDMQLKKLAALERQKIEEELKEIRKTITFLTDLLDNPQKILRVIDKEITEIREKYADPRRTKVFKSKIGEFSEEELIADEDAVVTITKTGYIKRQAPSSFRLQERGGKGVIGMTTKEEDQIDHILSCRTHDQMLFFTNKGKVYQTRVWELPESARTSKGQAVINLINIDQDEMVTSILTYNLKTTKKDNSKYIIMASEKGKVKKTKLSLYENIRKNGLVAIKLDAQDKLSWARLAGGDDDVLLITHLGKSIRFPEKEIKVTARDTKGVKGIGISDKDAIIGMEVINMTNKDLDILTITEKGLGKKTQVGQFPKQHRAGSGVKVAQINSKTGNIASVMLVNPEAKYLVLTSSEGQIVKLPLASVPKLARATQGVILMRFSKPNDTLASAACL